MSKIVKKASHVWFDDERWKVEEIFSPTAFDHYMLVSFTDDSQVHEDHKTSPVIMTLIDMNNDEFHWDVLENGNIWKEINEIQRNTDRDITALKDQLL